MADDEGRRDRARAVRAALAAQQVRVLAITWTDNAGVTRVKCVPLHRVEEIAGQGVGVAPVFDVLGADGSIADDDSGRTPVGDLRLLPDLDHAVPLAAEPGWAWVPGDRLRQDGSTHPGCGRSFARRMAGALTDAALGLRMAFETEWYVERRDGTPATAGPAYGVGTLLDLSGFAMDLLSTLERQAIQVAQFHPEAGPGQFELSVVATDPVRAADLAVLVRITIRATAARHDLRVSFAPRITARGGVPGSGAHLHLSPWRGNANLLSGGPGPHGMTVEGQAVLARLIERLDALCAISAPSIASYHRLRPGQWAGAFRCWGRENREAAVRLIAPPGGGASHANAELRCVDGAANPYLVVGAVCAVVGSRHPARLPDEVTVDPGNLPGGRRPPRLPRSLAEAVDRLATDDVLGPALGDPLLQAILLVRRTEIATWAGRDLDELIAATRWVY